MHRTFIIARRRLFIGATAAAAITLISPERVAARPRIVAPSTTQLMHVLDFRLQKLRPLDILYRTILFDQIQPGEPHGGVYPFVVSLTIHDYSAGWPPNGYFGKTCLSKLQKGTFTMQLTVARDWTIEGPITLSEPLCRPNPADRVSAFPLAELPGKRIAKGEPPAEVKVKRSAGVLMSGEYSCVTPTGRMLDNMRFRLKLDRTYTDLAGANGGKYVVDAVAGTVAFRGGFLDGRTGKDADLTHFTFPDVECRRWQ